MDTILRECHWNIEPGAEDYIDLYTVHKCTKHPWENRKIEFEGRIDFQFVGGRAAWSYRLSNAWKCNLGVS
jgi:hypothetical protein